MPPLAPPQHLQHLLLALPQHLRPLHLRRHLPAPQPHQQAQLRPLHLRRHLPALNLYQPRPLHIQDPPLAQHHPFLVHYSILTFLRSNFASTMALGQGLWVIFLSMVTSQRRNAVRYVYKSFRRFLHQNLNESATLFHHSSQKHFWWRLAQCMGSNHLAYYSDGGKCTVKEGWPSSSNIYDSLEGTRNYYLVILFLCCLMATQYILHFLFLFRLLWR